MKLDFLVKNYEKVLLAFILIIFVISLIWLVHVFYISEQERSTGISIISNKAKYNKIPETFYDYGKTLSDSVLWEKSSKRNLNKKDRLYILAYTDFMVPFRIARSNAYKAGGKLIPYAYYKYGEDPITKEKISLPDAAVLLSTSDLDKDEIPDIVEKQIGTNPTNNADKDYDIDNDSFTNLQDYKYKHSGINEGSIHPPLIKRLVLVDIAKTKIPFVVKKIIRRGADKKNWDIQINIQVSENRWKSKFLKIGSTIDLNDLVYKITNIESKFTEKLDPRLGAIIEYDMSEVILVDSTGEKITAPLNNPVYEPKRLITVKDLYTERVYKIRINNTITLGNYITGFETYKLVSINDKKNTLEFSREGTNYIVGKTTDYKVPVKNNI